MEKPLKGWILLKVKKYLEITNTYRVVGACFGYYICDMLYLYFRLAEEVVLLVLIELDLTDNVRI